MQKAELMTSHSTILLSIRSKRIMQNNKTQDKNKTNNTKIKIANNALTEIDIEFYITVHKTIKAYSRQNVLCIFNFINVNKKNDSIVSDKPKMYYNIAKYIVYRTCACTKFKLATEYVNIECVCLCTV